MTLNAQVQRLAQMRAARQEYVAQAKKLEEAIAASPQGQLLNGLKGKLAELASATEAAEEAVRADAVFEYNKTGSKCPHPAVKVKIFKRVIYDAKAALEYARQHIPNAVRLDARKFEKAALELDLGFVEVVAEPRAQIDQDLTGYMDIYKEERNEQSQGA